MVGIVLTDGREWNFPLMFSMAMAWFGHLNVLLLDRLPVYVGVVATVGRPKKAWRLQGAAYELIEYHGDWRVYPASPQVDAGPITDWPIVPEDRLEEVRALLRPASHAEHGLLG